ncbi:unnamed protein product [Arabidopsis lyrata]|nr:F-box protein At3g57590 [Arabidopsis lyrata subsp. lyrata]CAH8254052.1 unnamed protein product [Arabidopsis lyrata]|eukprot:XP_002893654.2 F-box protein At3g57590 [Arabidopsis lyrata subsp. lyrata]
MRNKNCLPLHSTIDAECFRDQRATRLINYKGKLGGIDLTYDEADAIVLSMSVLEDVEKEEWSKYVYTLPHNDIGVYNVFVVGMTARGEIVLAEKYTSKPFYVLYFNPEKNTLQSVEIQGVGPNGEAFETDCRVYAFVDHVEDLSVHSHIEHHSEGYGYGDGDGYEDEYEYDEEDES